MSGVLHTYRCSERWYCAGTPLAVGGVGGVVAAVAAPDTDHRAGDKTPVAASDADGAPDSQLSVVGDREGAEG